MTPKPATSLAHCKGVTSWLSTEDVVNISSSTYPRQGAAELGHSLVERNVLEEFDPWEKHANGHSIIGLLGPVNQSQSCFAELGLKIKPLPSCQVREVGILVRMSEQILKLVLDHKVGVHVQKHYNQRVLQQSVIDELRFHSGCTDTLTQITTRSRMFQMLLKKLHFKTINSKASSTM